jgi:light-regulated signal transduction histidine kinase (bacteriophytochrome)
MEFMSESLKINGGIPPSGRPTRTKGPILSPRTSFATSSERVRSGPDSPPTASRPWQNPHCAANRSSPARICSAEYVCGVTVLGLGTEAGL